MSTRLTQNHTRPRRGGAARTQSRHGGAVRMQSLAQLSATRSREVQQ